MAELLLNFRQGIASSRGKESLQVTAATKSRLPVFMFVCSYCFQVTAKLD